MVSFVIVYGLLAFASLICIPLIYYIKPTFVIDVYMYITILFHIFLWAFYGLFCSYISSYNKLPYSNTLIVSSLITVVLSICLVKSTDLGIWALVISPIIVSMYNLWKWSCYVMKNYLYMNTFEMIKLGTIELTEYVDSNFVKPFRK